MARTLDTDLTHICIDYFDDPAFHWHHRLLLVQLEGSQWIVATPDLSTEVVNLADHRVVTLPRAGAWPPRVRGNVYAFDPLAAADREDLMRQAVELAQIMGTPVASRLRVWRA